MFKRFNTFFFIIILFFFNNNSYSQDKIAFKDLNYVYSNSKIGKKIIKEDLLLMSNKRSINNTLTPNYFKKNYYTAYAIIL